MPEHEVPVGKTRSRAIRKGSRRWIRLMKTSKKIAIGVGALVVLAAVIGFTIHQSHKNLVTVQTSKVQRANLASIVSASGEIRPKTYVNIGADAFGKIIKLYVKEGDHVKRGQMLARLENVQPMADVNADQASLEAAQTDAIAAEAALNTATADLTRAKSDDEHAALDWKRTQSLYKDALIAKSDYDTQRAAWQTAVANLAMSQAKVAQARAQKDSADRHIALTRANLQHAADVLQKTTYTAPFDGTITNLPVREGETVVVGIQNSPGSTLMTLADMSTITAEVRVDETDIINVQMGQPAEVSIDALPDKTFKAVVSQIGDNAIVRSTGVSTSQSTAATDEAKDFKVVVTLVNPPQDLRPGLSATAKITTASRANALSVPIQALTVRRASELKPKEGKNSVQAAEPSESASTQKGDQEIQGVFVLRNGKAEFVPVKTGIMGATDMEVLSGLKQGDEIVTGSYKVLQTLKPGTSVKVDNSAPKMDQGS
jgi:HlyD family secretion protein